MFYVKIIVVIFFRKLHFLRFAGHTAQYPVISFAHVLAVGPKFY